MVFRPLFSAVGAGLLAVGGMLALVRFLGSGEMDNQPSQHQDQDDRKLRTLEHLTPNPNEWWPKWVNEYVDGYCTNVGVRKHGIPSFTNKLDCCEAWFPNQEGGRCLHHDGATEPPPTPPLVPQSAPIPQDTTNPPPSGPTTPFTLPPIPTSCQDVADWQMPGDSIWEGSPFVGKTCAELEEYVPSDQGLERTQFCDMLSQGVFTGPCASDACCFCGGGQLVNEQRCENMEWNGLQSGSNFSCETVDALPESFQEKICDELGSATFSFDELTLAEACCACGGGRQYCHVDDHELAPDRRLQEKSRNLQYDGIAAAGAAAATELSDGPSTIDFTHYDKGGDVGGIPNLEYLGLGYDLIRGNPRGTELNGLDPGFRHRVLRLRQEPSDLTVDWQYQIPLGVDVKYTSSCQYDDSSVEVTSESDIRRALAKESSFKVGGSASGPIKIALISASFSYSQSEKFQSVSETNVKTSSVSFEAKAMCSEFEASFIPGYNHEVTPEFQNALDELPVPYDLNNIRDRAKWTQFFDTYGINYVKYLMLGGKRIYSTSMTQEDYSSLVSQKVEVSRSLSFEMSAALIAPDSLKKQIANKASSLLGNYAAKKFSKNTGTIVNLLSNYALDQVLPNPSSSDETPPAPAPVVGASVSYSNFASSTKQAEDAEKMSEKKLTKQEFTIGGTPSDDWRAWASSVADKPMPIKYDLGSIAEFMNYEQGEAFVNAVEDIYGIDLSTDPQGPILKDTVRFGVYTGSGSPLSLHTLNTNDDTRVLMQNDVAFDGGGGGGPYDYDLSLPSRRLQGQCLDSEGRYYQSKRRTITRGKRDNVDDLDECKGYCEEVGQTIGNIADQVGFYYYFKKKNNGDFFSDCICYYDGNIADSELSGGEAGNLGSGGVRSSTGGPGFCYPNQGFRTRSDIFTYTDVWKGKTSKPTAIFGTPIHGSIAPNAHEDDNLPWELDDEAEPWTDNVYFALSEKINSNAVLAVTNYGGSRSNAITNDQLPCYSFLTAETLGRYGIDFMAGVISPIGLVQNVGGRDEFEVTQDLKRINVNFAQSGDNPTVPTVLVFPNWLATGGIYPNLVEDVPYAIHSIGPTGFSIRYQKESPHLGFNIAVIRPEMPTENLKHGIIYDCVNGQGPTPSILNGITVVDEGSSVSIRCAKDSTKIEFDAPFSDIPAVVVTPYIPTWGSFYYAGNWPTSGLPKCFVESITKTFARVKCYHVYEWQSTVGFEKIPFTFVAVGNTN